MPTSAHSVPMRIWRADVGIGPYYIKIVASEIPEVKEID